MLNLKKDRRGQALVEMAIILPVLLLLLMVIIDFGRIFNSYLIISNASREGARMALVDYNVDRIKTRVSETAYTLKGPVNTNITKSGVKITVQVEYRVNLIAPLITYMIPNPFTIRAHTTTYI